MLSTWNVHTLFQDPLLGQFHFYRNTSIISTPTCGLSNAGAFVYIDQLTASPKQGKGWRGTGDRGCTARRTTTQAFKRGLLKAGFLISINYLLVFCLPMRILKIFHTSLEVVRTHEMVKNPSTFILKRIAILNFKIAAISESYILLWLDLLA